MTPKAPLRTLEWIGDLDGHVSMIDQTQLPLDLVKIECRDARSIRESIQQLRVRGAPAIGIAGAMGAVLGIRDFQTDDRQALLRKLDEVCNYLVNARPTAVDLPWALDRMRHRAESAPDASVDELKALLLAEAKTLRDENAARCRAIGEHGQSLIQPGGGILTHCNAGSLATAEYGTALAPMYTAHESGRLFHVYATETRPLLQGSRLTAWELQQAGIDVTLVCDNMVGVLMKKGKIDLVITGADRIAANGDVANKIGTYGIAILAVMHGIPMYVAAPTSSLDLTIPDGSHIPIERRDPDEIRRGFGRLTAPPDVPCYTPAFDVTPVDLVRGLITEHGLVHPITHETLAAAIHGRVQAPA